MDTSTRRREEPADTAAIVYNQPQDEEIIPIECVGHIRPHATYDTDLGYGFDWMRVGDTTYNGKSIVYKGMVGKQHKRGTKTPIDDDVNKYDGSFEAQDAMYERLENEYNMASGARVFTKKANGDRERYYVPILALPRMRDIKDLGDAPAIYSLSDGEKKGKSMPIPRIGNNVAEYLRDLGDDKYFIKLELRLTITKSPKKLYWELPERYRESTSSLVKGKPIEIKCPEIPVAVCNNKKIEFEVASNVPIPETIDVKLMALGHNGKSRMVGVFRIWRNKSKKKKIVLVQVISDIGNGEKSFDVAKLKEESKFIKKYLSQALIIPEIEIIEEFNMKDTSFFYNNNLNSFKGGNKLIVNRNDKNIYAHLDSQFSKKCSYGGDVIKIFFIKEDAYKLKGTGRKSKLEKFWAANQAYTNLIIFTERDTADITASHEVMHALGVLHTFTNSEAEKEGQKATHTFNAGDTQNIMDYSVYRFSLWQWQWQRAHQ